MNWPQDMGVPEGVPREDPSADVTADSSTGPDAGEAVAQPDATPEPGADATSDAQPAAPDTGSPEGDHEPPPYRFEEVRGQRDRAVALANDLQSRFDRIEQENKNFKRMLAVAAGVDVDGGQPAGLSDKERDVAGRIFGLLERFNPNFAKALKIAERSDDLFSVADTALQRYTTDAQRTLTGVFLTKVAGDGKKEADVDKQDALDFQRDFVQWCARDPKREERYDSGDVQALAEEFVARQHGLYRAPQTRELAATARARADAAKRLPVGGSVAAPTGTPPKQPGASRDIDEVAAESWKQAHEAMTAG